MGTNVATKVNHIGLGFTGLENSQIGQRSIEGFLKVGQTFKRRRDEDGDADLIGDNDRAADMPSFTCTRCGKTILSDLLLSGVGPEDALVALRQEHDDFHFAQELAKEQQPDNSLVVSGSSKPTPSNISPKKKQKRRDPPSRGIEQFFSRAAS